MGNFTAVRKLVAITRNPNTDTQSRERIQQWYIWENYGSERDRWA